MSKHLTNLVIRLPALVSFGGKVDRVTSALKGFNRHNIERLE